MKWKAIAKHRNVDPQLSLWSAEFFLLFAPGPNGSKLEDSKFISGSDEMKDAGKDLTNVDFNVPFPDQGPERLLAPGNPQL